MQAAKGTTARLATPTRACVSEYFRTVGLNISPSYLDKRKITGKLTAIKSVLDRGGCPTHSACPILLRTATGGRRPKVRNRMCLVDSRRVVGAQGIRHAAGVRCFLQARHAIVSTQRHRDIQQLYRWSLRVIASDGNGLDVPIIGGVG